MTFDFDGIVPTEIGDKIIVSVGKPRATSGSIYLWVLSPDEYAELLVRKGQDAPTWMPTERRAFIMPSGDQVRMNIEDAGPEKVFFYSGIDRQVGIFTAESAGDWHICADGTIDVKVSLEHS